MEKAANVRVLEVRYDWNDVGDWRSLADLLPQDPQGNAIQGDVLAHETTQLDHHLRRRRPDRHARPRRRRHRPVRQGDPGRPPQPARQAERAGRRPREQGIWGVSLKREFSLAYQDFSPGHELGVIDF